MLGFSSQNAMPANRDDTDLRRGLKVTFVGLFVNLILGATKVSVGLLARSQGLIADGVHTISDLLSDIVTIVGLKWGKSPTDDSHPFGHGRIETFFSLIVGALLIGSGLYIMIAAIMSGISGVGTVPGIYAAAVAGLSFVTKEWLYRYTVITGKRIHSPVIQVNAWHHRSDALSSIAVMIGAAAGHLHESPGHSGSRGCRSRLRPDRIRGSFHLLGCCKGNHGHGSRRSHNHSNSKLRERIPGRQGCARYQSKDLRGQNPDGNPH